MALLHYKWSRVAASNATADANVGWSEGQAPSSINDSARAMMASAAGFRDDISGAIITGGTSTALTVSTYQVFDSLPNMGSHMVAFTPHVTNGATVTLNVDTLGAKPLRTSTGVELLSGMLIAGTPYTALYNNSDAVWYLHGFYGNPYNIPLGGALPYFGATAPNSAFVLPYGQAISRSTYSTLFTLFGTTYGAGDGSTTFNVPNLRGRVVAGKDDMGGSAEGILTATHFGAADGALATTLGAKGGSQAHTLTVSQIPSITSVNASQTITVGPTGKYVPVTASSGIAAVPVPSTGTLQAPYGNGSDWVAQDARFTGSNSISVTSSGTSGLPHNNVQPTIIGNYILRVI